MNENIKKMIPLIRKIWYVPAMLLLGVVLMMYEPSGKGVASSLDYDSDRAFAKDTERRIEEMLKSIEGAGACKVTVSLSTSEKKEYVREDGNVLVITDRHGNESAVLSQKKSPDIAGVTVASNGAGSLEVRTRIIESVSTVLGIGTNKICVVLLSG